jgi:hypothetical protein
MIIAPLRRCSMALRHRSRILRTSTTTTTGITSLRSSYSPLNTQYHTFAPTFSAAVGLVNSMSSSLSSGSVTCVSTKHCMSDTPNVHRTKKIVERNGGNHPKTVKTLYDPSRETENCGVGLIASLKSVPSRDVVLRADEMLVRMAHRGGCGCDPASGDGSGR